MKPGKFVTIEEEDLNCIECGKSFEVGEKAIEQYEGMLCFECLEEDFLGV